ncbi:hypothetical protein BGX30_012957 [Mortierella sp. GBA39]|nr:hypothetical protein BGX30_012957 [Mortierella sp. GBA39]
MAANTLTLFCLISGEHASRAFSVQVSSDKTVGALKDAIISKKPNAFEHIDANDLVLWRVTVPVVAGKTHEAVVLHEIDPKTELVATDEISELFKKKTLPKKSIHIIIAQPKGELERAIYDEYPDREDGKAVLTIIHARGTSQHEGGGTKHPSDDTRFRNIIRQYSKTNTRKLTVALETPTKKYTDFTLKEVNRLYEISNMETPTMSDLPPFTGISTEPLDSDLHKESLRRLLDELDSRIRAIPSDTFANESTCSAYVCSFLTQAVLIFDGELALAPKRPLRGRHGHGKVDYAIEALAKDGSRHVLGVTEVKHEDYRKGLAQNLVQLESSLTVRKRKRSSDDNEDEEREEDSTVPLRAYGIVTDASFWFFVECTIDPSQGSGDWPKFRISRLDDIVNYNKSTWRAEAASVLGQIVWLMRKMHSEVPGREL